MVYNGFGGLAVLETSLIFEIFARLPVSIFDISRDSSLFRYLLLSFNIFPWLSKSTPVASFLFSTLLTSATKEVSKLLQSALSSN